MILRFHAVAKKISREDPIHQTIQAELDRADEVMAEGREKVRNLREAGESLSDLPTAFRRVASGFSTDSQLTFQTAVEGVVRELHPVVLEEAYSVGREALLNAFTHSGALHVEAEIKYDAEQFRLRVRDDGCGVDPAVLEKGGRTGHWGLQGMRERARRIGGQVRLWSRPGAGTEVEFTIPAATAYRSGGTRSKMLWFRRSSSTGSQAL
jgi:signal transduction histidine kinase